MMFESGKTYWLKVRSSEGGDRVFHIKCKILEENGFMVKAEVSHGVDKPTTTEVIPFIRIVDVNANV